MNLKNFNISIMSKPSLYLKSLAFLGLITILFSLNSFGQDFQKTGKAKYIFLFIGDGMGLAQTSAAEAFLGAKDSIIGFKKLNMSQFPVQTFCTTYSQDNFYTCSAAAATALATGYKTSNGTLSMDSSHVDTLKTIAEIAYQAGMKVGIITTVSIDHATPAAFYAHQPSRNNYHEIAIDLVNSNFEFFGGGGLRNPVKVQNGDTVNIINLAKKNGYHIINQKTDFEKLEPSAGKVIVMNQRLIPGQSEPYAIDQNEDDITLTLFTSKAIGMLDNKNGFFIMVEGGSIDWLCHANDAAGEVREVIDFDEAIGEAVKFYRLHPDETLIIVVADHETGGMTMGTTITNEEQAFSTLQEQKMSMEAFSLIVKKYREDHPGGKANFDEMLGIIKDNFGLGTETLKLSDYEKKQLEDAFKLSMQLPSSLPNNEQNNILYDEKEPLAIAAAKLLASKSGIGWTTFGHTAIPVPLRALGRGQELFMGFQDNTDVAKNILTAAGL